jgi:hypothetical protein
MSTLQSLRFELIEILTGYTDENEELLSSKLEEFVREYWLEMMRLRSLKPPLTIKQDALHSASREITPPRRPIIGPPKWNTPVSPFTGVANDGSDGHFHAPLPRECFPLNFEHYLARQLWKNLPFFPIATNGLEEKEKSIARLLSILTEARDA